MAENIHQSGPRYRCSAVAPDSWDAECLAALGEGRYRQCAVCGGPVVYATAADARGGRHHCSPSCLATAGGE